jgi:beta-glucanase (GH16 family)
MRFAALAIAVMMLAGALLAQVPVPAPPTGVTVGGPSNALFFDDFNGSGVDTAAWQVRNGSGDTSNSEQQWYAPANVLITPDHYVQILTKVESYSGLQYTSGLIQFKTFNYTYGTLEVRALMPGGMGTWPAIWMLGYGMQGVGGPRCSWPSPGCEEIDIAEFMNHSVTTVNQQIHTSSSDAGCRPALTDASRNWHVYKLIWAAGSLKWHVDGVTTCTVTSSVPSSPMYLIINTAVGGIGGGSVDSSTLPQTMLVDYVKVTR